MKTWTFRAVWELQRLLLELFSQASLLVLRCLRLWQRREQGRSKGQWHPLCHLPTVLLSALAQLRVKQLFSVHPALQSTWALLYRAWRTKGHRLPLTEGWNVYEQPQTSGGAEMVVPWMFCLIFFIHSSSHFKSHWTQKMFISLSYVALKELSLYYRELVFAFLFYKPTSSS